MEVQDTTPKNKISGVIGGVVLVVVIVILALFAWRVLYFYNKISQGTLNPSDFNFTGSVTTSNLVAQPDLETLNLDAQRLEDGDDPTLGNEEAELTIVEFADFGCPFSRQASSTLRRLAAERGDQIRYVYRDFPLVDIHPEAQQAAEAGQCAWEQDANKFWAYHDKLYQNQTEISVAKLKQYALAVGLDEQQFNNCLDSGKYEAEVLKDFADGQALGVYGTPTFFFNGQRIAGAIPEQILNQIVTAFVGQ